MSYVAAANLLRLSGDDKSVSDARLGGSLALPERFCLRCEIAAATVVIMLFLSLPAANAHEDEEPAEPPAGLIATYTAADGHAITRIDERLRFTWNESPPDPRLSLGAFTAHWTGKLAIQSPGAYRLHVYAGGGTVEVKLGGKQFINGDAQKPQWLDSAPVELDFGEQPLEITFRAAGPTAQIGLYWSGPKFQLEPIPPRLLSHTAGRESLKEFDDGRLLVRALRCAACHDLPDAQPILPAPALSRLAGNLDHEWLMTWIGGKPDGAATEKKEPAPPPDSDNEKSVAKPPEIADVKFRMPGLGASRADAQHIVAWLDKNSQPALAKPSDEKELKAAAEADSKSGEELFLTLGCLACHQFKSLGGGGVYGGGDLSAVGAKRPADFFARWLATPEASNPSHRMPVFPLSPEQRADLAKFLSEQGTAEASPKDEPTGDPKRGAELIAAHRCAACHAIDGKENETAPQPAAVKKRRLSADADFGASCLGEPDVERHRPGYRLRPEQRAAVERYIREIATAPVAKTPAPQIVAARLFTERNCLACHARGLNQGIVTNSPALAEAHPELASLLPALAPPSLNDVGDKLKREAIIAAFTTSAPPLRPWLKIRMPRFSFTPAESQALAAWFADSDLIPDRRGASTVDAKPPREISDQVLTVAGRRLVTAEGFGCASCHQIGRAVPKQDNIAAMGTDLSEMGRRIRRSWYDRWVRNPARIVPRMEMPSIELAVRGVLDEQLDDQLAAVWHVLNLPNFTPPEPGAVRVVRARNLPDAHEPAAVLTDVITIDKHPFIRPLVMALPNRQTVLFDLEQNRLAGWWLGDAAAQRTRGKTWYWEAAGTHLFDVRPGAAELELLVGKNRLKPIVRGQFAAELDSWRHSRDGVALTYRLHFEAEDANEKPPITLRVTQTLEPLWPTSKEPAGFRRSIEVEGVPYGAKVAWRLLPKNVKGLTITPAGAWTRGGPLDVRYGKTPNGRLEADGDGAILLVPNVANKATFDATYFCSLAADRFPVAPPSAPTFPAATLDVTPGWNAVRLPLPTDPMPTAFAWRKDGAMIFTSLKGQVWLATDTNGDGLADKLTPISDELAAPYGVVARDDSIDVVNKNAVVRLTDFDKYGRAQHTDVVASGWGHTADYHDWAVGIVPDGASGYFTAIPCWQDKRDAAAAKFRGECLQLTPRQPTTENPRLFDVDSFCGGLRFPMGLARNRARMLFASDNQGNYNPFNELNYLEAGAHYGFFNKQAATEGRPPRRDPAIEIPHPWTRSVNGICFLETPDDLRKRTGKDVFGPWEGHLVGCEYDTRRLVRMSIDQVDGVVQGAAYPLSVEPAEDAETFEGPVACAVAPDGALFIGNIRDSGWGGGQNTGSIVRMTVAEEIPAGIAEVRAAPDGFTILFTQPVDAARGAEVTNYDVASYRRISTPDYGGPEVDRQPSRIRAVKLSADRRQAHVSLDRLREGFVYELRVKNLAEVKERFHPAEAYYTLRKVAIQGERTD